MSEGMIYGEGFAVLPEAILYAPGVSPTAKLLWATYARHADRLGRAYPGRQRLAELLGVSPETVKRAKAELAEAGLIRVKERFDEAGRRTTDDVFLTHARVTSDPGVGVTSDPTRSKASKNERTASDQGSKNRGPTRTDPTWIRPNNFVEDLDKLPEKQVEQTDEERAQLRERVRLLKGAQE